MADVMQVRRWSVAPLLLVDGCQRVETLEVRAVDAAAALSEARRLTEARGTWLPSEHYPMIEALPPEGIADDASRYGDLDVQGFETWIHTDPDRFEEEDPDYGIWLHVVRLSDGAVRSLEIKCDCEPHLTEARDGLVESFGGPVVVGDDSSPGAA